MKKPKQAWSVVCFGCGAVYVDVRRRVGRCLRCKSAAVIVTKDDPRAAS